MVMCEMCKVHGFRSLQGYCVERCVLLILYSNYNLTPAT